MKKSVHIPPNVHIHPVVKIILWITIIFLLINHFVPNFFIHDDTISYSIPIIKVMGDTLFKHAQIPYINYYEYLGHPLFEQGQTGVLYPIHYIAYLIGTVAGNYNSIGMSEVYIHFLVAGIAMYYLLKTYSADENIATFCALGYTFSGFNVTLGNNWLFAGGYYAFIPLLLIFLLKEKLIIFSIVNALLFSLGYIQFFVLINIFLFLFYVLSIDTSQKWRKLLMSYAVTLILILPILIPFLVSSRFSVRSLGIANPYIANLSIMYVILSGFGVLIDITNKSTFIYQSIMSYSPIGLFFLLFTITQYTTFIKNAKIAYKKISTKYLYKPYTVIGAVLILVLHLYMQSSFLESILFTVLEMSALIACIVGYVKKRRIVSLRGLVLLFVLLSSGRASIFTYFITLYYYIFRWPFKWYIVTPSLFSILIALYFQKYFSTIFKKYVFLLTLCLSTSIILVFVVFHTSTNFNETLFTYDTIDVPPSIQNTKDRIVPVGFTRTHTQSEGLSGNYSTYFDILSWAGYDPLISLTKFNLISLQHVESVPSDEYYYKREDYLDAYGVRYYVSSTINEPHITFTNDDAFNILQKDDKITLFEKENVDPIVFDENKSPLSYEIQGNNIVITMKESVHAQTVTLGFYKEYDHWQAKTDAGLTLPVSEDQFKRITVTIPAHTQLVTVSYVDTFFLLGLKLTIGLLIVVGGVAAIVSLRRKKQTQ